MFRIPICYRWLLIFYSEVKEMIYRNRIALFIAVLACLIVASPASAQTPAATPSTADLQERIRQLETQMIEMRGELDRLKRDASAKTEPQIVPISAMVAEPSTPASQAAKQETKPAPKVTGIDLGPVRATPYGTIYFNAFGNSGGTNNADDPLFATPTNQGNTSMSVRQTRLGLKLEGPTIAHAKSRGQIEADFFGGFPAVGVGDNFGIVRLRLAFARLDWEKTSLEAGQDWTIFAPNNPMPARSRCFSAKYTSDAARIDPYSSLVMPCVP